MVTLDVSSIGEYNEVLDREGYVLVRRMVDPGRCAELRRLADAELEARVPPLELEADVGYPGAPRSRAVAGGETIRRLLALHARHPAFSGWARSGVVKALLERHFGGAVRLSLAHHNSLMTKHPRHGSATGWHRDIRYWSFEREDLVSARLALGSELPSNGAIQFIPRSHRMSLDRRRFDDALFFREELAENRDIIDTHVEVEMRAGDAVFFHCHTLHRAGQNGSAQVKLSLNFAYHGADNFPVQGTRSAGMPSIAI
ncbi:phytanoyl-CoA dioxygenase family protein [Burkholderia gladioli]|uniref:phytanoyl-CoA dioxygenase family protein n=1 Tax=Burkholderia gladioli TaxID=28095 RepID=UPI00163F37C8|nr:phytanoyl-CoA dioxygenase family protein [Burkholderia gladioli]